LVDIDVADGEPGLAVAAGVVGVFAQQGGDVAVGLGQLLAVAVVGQGDDDGDVALELLEIRLGLGERECRWLAVTSKRQAWFRAT
jgi:hypothetical protein